MGAVRSSVQVAVHETVAEGLPQPGINASSSDILALPAPPRRTRAWLWAGAAVAVLLGTWFAYRRSVRLVPANQKVVLADLENRTGDPELDDVLRQALEIDLDQSPFIDVMGETEALNTLRLMGSAPETAFAPAVAREVCERSNRQVLLTGSVASVGQKFLIALKATDCISGKTIAAAKAEVANKDDLLSALDSASAALRHGLGESAESLQRFQVPVAQATTSSLDALKQYSTGEYLLGRMGKEQTEVLPFFQRALELDPQFAMASAAIATGYFSLGEYKLAVPYYQKAFDLSDRVSEKERLYIRAHYYADDKRDVRQGLLAYRMWAEVYPRDWGPWLNIANEYAQLGQFDAAVAAAEHALSLDPSRGIIYSVLARNYMHVGRYGDAESTVARAHSIGKESHLLDATLFETALLESNGPAMDREVSASSGKEDRWDLLDLQALTAAKDGRYKRSEELFHAAFDTAMRENLSEKANGILIDQASAELDTGNSAASRATLRRIAQQNQEAPFLLAEMGDIAPAQHALAALGSPTGPDTLLTYVYGPCTRAQIALNLSKPLQAIAELQSAAEFDFAAGYAIVAERAEAYLKAHQPVQAASEYRRILDHPGVDPVSPLLPLAQLGLARAESQAGLVDQSRTDYEKLFDQWKNADPDLPILLAARREYASLNSGHSPIDATH
jgi:tetratricopeptide (TPR) repeat protein